MRKALVLFAAFFLTVSPVMAQETPPPTGPGTMPGLNTDMDDMSGGPGTALPPPGVDAGKVKRMMPGDDTNIPPSEAFPNVPAANDPTSPQGAPPPSQDANVTPSPVDADAPPAPVIPGDSTQQPPLPPAATPAVVPPPVAPVPPDTSAN